MAAPPADDPWRYFPARHIAEHEWGTTLYPPTPLEGTHQPGAGARQGFTVLPLADEMQNRWMELNAQHDRPNAYPTQTRAEILANWQARQPEINAWTAQEGFDWADRKVWQQLRTIMMSLQLMGTQVPVEQKCLPVIPAFLDPEADQELVKILLSLGFGMRRPEPDQNPLILNLLWL